jgi:hypothetical protein
MNATRPEQLRALERGRDALAAWQQLLETGTDEQIAMELWRRAALIRADIAVARVLARVRAENLAALPASSPSPKTQGVTNEHRAESRS